MTISDWINVSISIATFMAVAAALFGDAFRRVAFGPKLKLSLRDPRGFLAPVFVHAPDGSTRQTHARWYHLRLENERKWSPATHVQVFLLQVDKLDASGEYAREWAGELPLARRHAEFLPGDTIIGPGQDHDLFSIVKDSDDNKGKWAEIKLLIPVLEFERRMRGKSRCRLKLQARSLEGASNVLLIEPSWDGNWNHGNEEMQRHFVIRVLPNPSIS